MVRQKQTPANDLMGLWENLYFSRVILYTKWLNWSINLLSSSIFACVKGRHGDHYKGCKQEQCVSLFSWWYFGVWQQRGEKEDQDERLHRSASPQQPKASQGECTVAGNRPTTTGEWFTLLERHRGREKGGRNKDKSRQKDSKREQRWKKEGQLKGQAGERKVAPPSSYWKIIF